jgi:hypothetical protein
MQMWNCSKTDEGKEGRKERGTGNKRTKEGER